jgi:hypothetical protein
MSLAKTRKKPASIPLFTREARIKRQLREHLRSLGFTRDEAGHLQPPELTKECFRRMHQAQRAEKLTESRQLVEGCWPKLRQHFADGTEVDPTKVAARLEIVASDTWQSDLFRLACLTWSVPVSQGYGRRMRYLVWDDSNGKLIGLMALGDPVFNLKVRDDWIGWTVEQRRQRLVDVMDAYVLGSVPPYNMLLGGKLVACLAGTVEVRDSFAAKYAKSKGLISKKRKRPSLCLVTTTSALGRSAVYNRLKLNGRQVFESIGYTSGWGHFHIPDRLFASMREYLAASKDAYANNHQYGDGPNWKLRAVRKVLSQIGMNPDLLRHGIAREVFACCVAANASDVLKGQSADPDYADLPDVATVSSLARERWLVPRADRMPQFRAWRRDALLELLAEPRRLPALRRAVQGG